MSRLDRVLVFDVLSILNTILVPFMMVCPVIELLVHQVHNHGSFVGALKDAYV